MMDLYLKWRFEWKWTGRPWHLQREASTSSLSNLSIENAEAWRIAPERWWFCIESGRLFCNSRWSWARPRWPHWTGSQEVLNSRASAPALTAIPTSARHAAGWAARRTIISWKERRWFYTRNDGFLSTEMSGFVTTKMMCVTGAPQAGLPDRCASRWFHLGSLQPQRDRMYGVRGAAGEQGDDDEGVWEHRR